MFGFFWENSDSTFTLFDPELKSLETLPAGTFAQPYGHVVDTDGMHFSEKGILSYIDGLRNLTEPTPTYELQYRHCNRQCSYCAALTRDEYLREKVVGDVPFPAPKHEKFSLIITGGEPLVSSRFAARVIEFIEAHKSKITHITLLTALKFETIVGKPLPEYLASCGIPIEVSLTCNGSPRLVNAHEPYGTVGWTNLGRCVQELQDMGFSNIVVGLQTNANTLKAVDEFAGMKVGFFTMLELTYAEMRMSSRRDKAVAEAKGHADFLLIQEDHHEFHTRLSAGWQNEKQRPWLINNSYARSFNDMFDWLPPMILDPYFCTWPMNTSEWQTVHYGKKCLGCPDRKSPEQCFAHALQGCESVWGSECLKCPAFTGCQYLKSMTYDCTSALAGQKRPDLCSNIRRDVAASLGLRFKDTAPDAIRAEMMGH